MKMARVEIGAILEVYLNDDQPEKDAVAIATEQVRRLDESESGIHDPDLYLANYAVQMIDCEEVDCG